MQNNRREFTLAHLPIYIFCQKCYNTPKKKQKEGTLWKRSCGEFAVI